jgi:N-methylhydantoinase A/oxoprolinase/acetone carboxylase beta subunit
MMLSDGALTTLEQATRFPIRLVEGGPAGGVALAAHVAREMGSTKTLDIGGTTAKICFIEGGAPKTSRGLKWRGRGVASKAVACRSKCPQLNWWKLVRAVGRLPASTHWGA